MSTAHENRRANLKALIQELGGQRVLAERTASSAAHVSQMASGHRDMGDEVARRIESHLGLQRGAMDLPELGSNRLPAAPDKIKARDNGDRLDDGSVLIKETRISFAAGPGHKATLELLEESEPATYRLSWFQKERMNPARCIRYRITNDSHEPFLFPGDTILVNLDETDPKDGKTYAMRYGDDLRVKKLRKRVGGGLVLESWNERLYPPEILTPEQVDEYITIIGRVRDKSGRGGL